MTAEHIHVSTGITKLGTGIPSVSLPPLCTCRPNAPCRAKCYAMKGRWRFGHNKDLLQKNLRVWKENPEEFRREVVAASIFSQYFRWHSAGDIPDMAYLEMMVSVAEYLPYTKFLCFTKKFELVNQYLDAHKSFPKNLCIVLSAWGSFLPANPYNLPVAYVRFKKGEQNLVPADARRCSNYCGDCVMSGCSCWNLKNGESVCFNEH